MIVMFTILSTLFQPSVFHPPIPKEVEVKVRTCLEGFLVSVVSVINSFQVTGVSLVFGFPEFLAVSGFIGYWCSRGFTVFLETLSFVKSKKALSYQRSL